MQRFLSFLLMFFAVTLVACAGIPERPAGAEPPPVKTKPMLQSEVTLSPLASVAPPVAAGVDLPHRPLDAVMPAVSKNTHVALLLPLNSLVFGRAAEVVKEGFMAAAAVQSGDFPIKVYPSGDQTDDIVATYQRATQAGARIVVGPLTKNGVTALAASKQVSVPTLALNLPEAGVELPGSLYLLALAADVEARQIAQMAYGAGHRTAAVVASGSALSKRMQLAFANEWPALGGSVVAQLSYNSGNASAIRDALLKSPVDMLFLAMDGQEARLLRPYLNPEWPVYATSQIYAGKNNPQKYHDLNGIQFIDMPWLLQPDHIAVMVYPRPQMPLAADLERLYALGIDAWRLALMLQAVPTGEPFSLDGVTGQLSLGRAHQLNRQGVAAIFRDGEATLLAP